jgi:hypothetical protein
MKEKWKTIKGFEGLYEISNYGRVKRITHTTIDTNGRLLFYEEKFIKNSINRDGYITFRLIDDSGIPHTIAAHILVAKAFIPNPKNLPCVNHKDENKQNPIASNLEWCTYSYNSTYGTLPERRKKHPTISIPENSIEISAKFQQNISTNDMNEKRKSHQKFVVKIDENGNEIERYTSVSEAGKKNGFDRHLFSRTKSINGIKLIKNKLFIIEEKSNEYIPKGKKTKRPDLSKILSTPVCQYSKDGTFIHEYQSIKVAAQALNKRGGCASISNCCNGKLKTAYGYIWRHKGDKAPEPFKHNQKRKIEQYTIAGEFVAVFNSIIEAAKSFNAGSPTSITNNLAGRSHSAFGYIWKYAKEE